MKYPRALLPTTGKWREHKQTYCMRLARNLEHFDRHPEVWTGEIYNRPPPPLLKLPAELRHIILFHVLDGNEIYWPRPSSNTQSMALVCKTFAEDIREVSKLWDAREAELRAECGTEKKVFNAYMEDLMGGLGKMSGFLANQRAAAAAASDSKQERDDVTVAMERAAAGIRKPDSTPKKSNAEKQNKHRSKKKMKMTKSQHAKMRRAKESGWKAGGRIDTGKQMSKTHNLRYSGSFHTGKLTKFDD